MKSKNVLIAGMLMLMPTVVMGQENIQKAFDALRKSQDQKEMNAIHSIERNIDTGMMDGMEDVYDFLITDPSAWQLVDDIRKAFEQDEPQAYSVSSGTHGSSEAYVSLAVGDSNSRGVAIGLMQGSKWVYACFLDPYDSLRQHRYAYALEVVEDEQKIRGRIAKTYATTLKSRQGRRQSRAITWSGFSSQEKTSEAWLTEFNTFKNLFLKNPGGAVGNSYATLIYKLCKDAKSLEDVERNMVATEIVKIRKKTDDDFIRQLFDMSIERLKK